MATQSHCLCLEKVGEQEPIFVLRGQDKTADVTVAFWASLNAVLAKERAQGRDDRELDDIVEEIAQDVWAIFNSKRWAVEWPDTDYSDPALTPKLKEAFTCASAMANWPNRKYPD